MPSLTEQIRKILECLNGQYPDVSFGEQCARELEQVIRQSWGGERVYIPPPNSRVNSHRGAAIAEAAKKLPTGVVRERFGVSRQLVHYHVQKGKKPDA